MSRRNPYTVHRIEQPTVLRFTSYRWSLRKHGIPIAVYETEEAALFSARTRWLYDRFNR